MKTKESQTIYDLRFLLLIFTWMTVLFIPTYSVTESLKEGIIMREETYFWPWMILIRFMPSQPHTSVQYSVVAFPWSYILFIPFIYILRASWTIWVEKNEIEKIVINIAIAAIIQIVILHMTFLSQDFSRETGVEEETITVYYVPQIILIFIYSTLFVFMKMKNR